MRDIFPQRRDELAKKMHHAAAKHLAQAPSASSSTPLWLAVR
jgi:hypothetical protein